MPSFGQNLPLSGLFFAVRQDSQQPGLLARLLPSY
jgi:hypothetical protein